MPKFASTYFGLHTPSRWLRGNHHGHSTVSDGISEPLEIVAAYEAAGYHYLALSEHDCLLKPEAVQPHTAMTLLPAVEVTSRDNQTLMHLGADQTLPARELTPREIMEQVHQTGGLFVFNHPNWQPRPDYATDELLDTMEGMRGMEIYCGVIERSPGQAQATNRWDRLLSKGWRVFGHGTDDQHEPRDHFIAWNCVQWSPDEAPSPQGIVEALRTGRFYASTGATINRVGTDEKGETVLVESDADEIHWIIRDGVMVKKSQGGRDSLSMEDLARLAGLNDPQEAVYLRAECLGHGNRCAWTQPFGVESATPPPMEGVVSGTPLHANKGC